VHALVILDEHALVVLDVHALVVLDVHALVVLDDHTLVAWRNVWYLLTRIHCPRNFQPVARRSHRWLDVD
jgi:hypothetical protein